MLQSNHLNKFNKLNKIIIKNKINKIKNKKKFNKLQINTRLV